MVAGGAEERSSAPPSPAPASAEEQARAELQAAEAQLDAQQPELERALQDARAAAIAETFSGSQDLNHYRGSPELLRVLEEYPPTHELRLTLQCQLFRECEDGELELIPRSWQHQLPTWERVARLVAAGELAPGWYVVTFRRGHASAPNVRFKVGAPSLVAARPNDSGEHLERAVRLLRQLSTPALPAGKGSAEAERLDRLEAAIVAIQQGQERLETALGEVLGEQVTERPGSWLGTIVSAVMDRMGKGPGSEVQTPPSAPAALPGPAQLRDLAR